MGSCWLPFWSCCCCISLATVMTANESLVCSLTIFCSGQTNGRNIHRRPSRASSGLLSSSFEFLFSLFLFHDVSSRCCGPLCFHLLRNRHQHNSAESECSIQLVFYERENKESERDEPVKTLIDGLSRYRSCVPSPVSFYIVTSHKPPIPAVGFRGHYWPLSTS